MDTIQEALRQLMGRAKDNKKIAEKSQKLNEDIKAVKEKEALLPELWDQVYCTLIDAGDNKIYEICGGKGKYNPDEAAVKNATSKYGDNIISIIYDENDTVKPETIFFAEAKRVAEKFSLKTDRTQKRNLIFFNVYVPQDEPVYFDFIPEKFRKQIALQNAEDLDDLPVSPSYSGDALVVEELEDESLTEELTVALPVTILPEGEILEFIDSVPKATKDRGPASLTFAIGFVTELDKFVASQYKENGRGHINKETGAALPVVTVVKCSEISGLYLESYGSSKKTIAHRRQMTRYEQEKEPEADVEPKREFVSWLEPVDEHRGLFRSKSTGELVLVPLAAMNSKTKTRYFISVDGQALRASTKDEIIPYLTPAKQAELTNGRDDKVKFGPDGKEIIGPAQPLNFYLKKIYRIGDKGQSIF